MAGGIACQRWPCMGAEVGSGYSLWNTNYAWNSLSLVRELHTLRATWRKISMSNKKSTGLNTDLLKMTRNWDPICKINEATYHGR